MDNEITTFEDGGKPWNPFWHFAPLSPLKMIVISGDIVNESKVRQKNLREYVDMRSKVNVLKEMKFVRISKILGTKNVFRMSIVDCCHLQYIENYGEDYYFQEE